MYKIIIKHCTISSNFPTSTSEISNGIDVWLKRTDGLIIDKWYAPGSDYHTDRGEGLDCYKVGRTLGGYYGALVYNKLCHDFRSRLLGAGQHGQHGQRAGQRTYGHRAGIPV